MTQRRIRGVEQAEDRIHLLLVEDRPEDAFVVERLLRKQAPETQTVELHKATTLAEAAKFLEQQKLVHTILLDLSLPDSRGLDTLSRVRRMRPDVPVVVLSGVDDDQTAAAAVRLGAHSYVAKQDISRAGNIWDSVFQAVMSTTRRRVGDGEGPRREGKFFLDRNHKVVRWDEHCELLSGLSQTQVRGKALENFVPEAQQPELRAMLERPSAAEDAPLEVELRDTEGHRRLVRLIPELALEGSHETLWLMSDASAERALHQSYHVLDHWLRVSREVVLSIDLDGRVLAANPAIQKLLGWEPKDALDRRLVDWLGPVNKAKLTTMLLSLRKGNEVRQVALQWPTADGKTKGVMLYACPLRDDLGGIVGGSLVALELDTAPSWSRG